MTILEGKSVEYRVGKISLVSDVNFRIKTGEFVAIVGPNGAGKSTLLRLMAGDLRPSEGQVSLGTERIEAFPYDDLALRRSILLQNRTADIPFTVGAVVAMGRHPHRMNPDNSSELDRQAVAAALERTETSHLTHRVFATLSSGEQTRVSLARILAQDAPIVLLDEPTTALDVVHEERMMAEFRTLASAGTAVVAVLHDLNAAAYYASRIVMIADGSVKTEGAADAVFTDDILTEVYGQPMRVVDHPFRDCPLVLVDDRTGPRFR